MLTKSVEGNIIEWNIKNQPSNVVDVSSEILKYFNKYIIEKHAM